MAINSIRKSDRSLHHMEGGGWVFLFILLSLLFAACNDNSSLSREEQAARDSAALHVALMPVHDCFPAYYAQQTGIYDSLGLDLRIVTLQAQLDTDTALMRGHAEIIYSDLVRAIFMQQDTTPLRAVAATEGIEFLITTRRGRVRKLNQLKERMVAVARHSITDYWSDRLTDTAQLARADIFRPQINNVRIRTDMICNNTMDAAFLPAPYAQEALMRGHRQNFTTKKLSPRLTVFVAKETAVKDSTRCQQIRLFLKGYDIAAEALNGTVNTGSLTDLYKRLYQTPDSLLDTLFKKPLPYVPVTSPQLNDAEAALQWLKSRGQIHKGYSLDSLLYDLTK